MALIFFMAYLDNRDNPSYSSLKQMAVSIADEIDWAGEEYNRFEKKRLRYIKAYIQGDLEDLRKQIEEEEDIGALPSICIVIESYIAACIEAGDNMGALAYLDKYMEYESAMRGEGIREYILPLKSKLESGQKMEFLPWRVEKDPDRELDLLDVLDRISVKEEIWRYSQGRYTGLFPGIEKEGFFEMIQMPDGNASLVPCNPSFNSYYRGQSSYFEDCYSNIQKFMLMESIDPQKKGMLDNVPTVFSTAEAIQAGKEVGMSQRTVMYVLNKLEASKILRRIKRGEYEKLQ